VQITLAILAGLAGAAGVALGAFGAHALAAKLDASALTTWETGVRYHLVHALALLLAAYLADRGPLYAAAGFLFAAGIVLFSGSLYGLALGGPRWLGPVTPLGGVSFILGWLAIGVALARTRGAG
jgi:uncharacterized membrane protein YgdD (TMEM256/DUF423 family)